MARMIGLIGSRLQSIALYRRLIRKWLGQITVKCLSEADLQDWLARENIVPGRTGHDWAVCAERLTVFRRGSMIGYVYLVHHSESVSQYPGWWIFNLWVKPLWRGAGIGSLLSRAAVDLGARQGAGAIHLLVHRDNLRAIHLYQKLDFVERPALTKLKPDEIQMTHFIRPEPESPG